MAHSLALPSFLQLTSSMTQHSRLPLVKALEKQVSHSDLRALALTGRRGALLSCLLLQVIVGS